MYFFQKIYLFPAVLFLMVILFHRHTVNFLGSQKWFQILDQFLRLLNLGKSPNPPVDAFSTFSFPCFYSIVSRVITLNVHIILPVTFLWKINQAPIFCSGILCLIKKPQLSEKMLSFSFKNYNSQNKIFEFCSYTMVTNNSLTFFV